MLDCCDMTYRKEKKGMYPGLVAVCLLAALLFPPSTTGQKPPGPNLLPSQIAKNVMPSVVSLVMTDARSEKIKYGSGFFVEKDIVVTNFHVIEGATEGVAKYVGDEIAFKILGTVGIDRTNDLALLKLGNASGKPLFISPRTPAVGDATFAVGNPRGLEGTFSQGIVSGIRKTKRINLL